MDQPARAEIPARLARRAFARCAVALDNVAGKGVRGTAVLCEIYTQRHSHFARGRSRLRGARRAA